MYQIRVLQAVAFLCMPSPSLNYVFVQMIKKKIFLKILLPHAEVYYNSTPTPLRLLPQEPEADIGRGYVTRFPLVGNLG